MPDADPVWEAAFAEVRRKVQPAAEPALTYGDGLAADPASELDAILLSSVRGVVWGAGLEVTYGQLVFPLTRMGRVFRVKTGGTLGATEPSWGDADFSVVSDNTALLEEWGSDYPGLYDTDRAIFECWELKLAKASEYEGGAESSIYKNCAEQSKRVAPVGIA
jgi:hypothetical protein